MRILHISDLHFGKHSASLQKALFKHVKNLKPRVIVCTGDVSDNRDPGQLEAAYAFLNSLTALATGPDNRMIVVPGNHDYREYGFLWKGKKQFDAVFDARRTDAYYEDENVWIYGFDSAEEGGIGGSGVAKTQEIERFLARCDELHHKYPAFVNSYKIAAVHHHPLPVNWDQNDKQRWLTMENAGRFLSTVLSKQVDLVLHGHEHLQARSRFASTLGEANPKHELKIVSVGATLKEVANPERNFFGLLEVTPRSSRVQFYASLGLDFVPDGDAVELRSLAESAAMARGRAAAEAGYVCHSIASITEINEDGDARRSLEFDDVEVADGSVARGAGHALKLPPTSGYLDRLAVRTSDETRSVHLKQTIPSGGRLQTFESRVEFDPAVAPPSATISYTCEWYAVNAFALDERQFTRLYGQNAQPKNREFTYYEVTDPVEELTIVAKFPPGVSPQRPRLFLVDAATAATPASWKRVGEIETKLIAERALRYYDSLNVAALRVTDPEIGVCYGIEWEVPKSTEPRASEPARGQVAALTRSWSEQPAPAAVAAAQNTLAVLADTARSALMGNGKTVWRGALDVSLLYLAADGKLKVVAAVDSDKRGVRPHDYSGVALSFGDGIAGRAFKANQTRVHVADEDQTAEPNFYTTIPGVEAHQVLLCIPVQAPDGDRLVEPYGVLSLGSTEPDCPLRIAKAGGAQWEDCLKAFRRAANEQLFAMGLEAFLGYTPVPAVATPRRKA